MAEAAEWQNTINGWTLSALIATLFATFAAVYYARRAAIATHQTVGIMETTANQQLRAYLNYESGNALDAKTNTPTVQLVFKNFGQTPAYDIRVRVGITATKYPLSGALPSIEKATQTFGVLAPQAHYVMRRTLNNPPLPAPVMEKFMTGEVGLYVHGEILYDDAFKRTQFTRFRLLCRHAPVPNPQYDLETCEEGNDAS